MAYLSHNKKEIRAKIVYYGPGLSGKTSNVEYIYAKMRSDHRGDLVNLSTRERTLFFDFLPVELGNIKGYRTSFHIFTVPGQVFYNETRRAVLNDVDGLVFVADSQRKMRDENVRSLKNLEENLASYGYKLSEIPHVFQYNKRDMPDIMTVEELHTLLNKTGAPFFEAVATEGSGVLNTLKLISKMVLKKLASSSEQIKESEEAFETSNYGLSDEYVALRPGEQAEASVKAVTAMEFTVDTEQAGEAPAAGEDEEALEADVRPETADESEISLPPPGTEWTPPTDEADEQADEAGEGSALETAAVPGAEPEPVQAAEEVGEVVEEAAVAEVPEATETDRPREWQVKENAGEQAGAHSPTPHPPEPPLQAHPAAEAHQLNLYQWGFPERIDVNTIRIPLFFRDEQSKEEYWSYLTLSLEHIYKRM